MDYIVSQNDTLFSIAQRFGVTVQELVFLNGLSPFRPIFPGMRIRIPGRFPLTPIPPVPPIGSIPPGTPFGPPGPRIYTVRRGDTLWSIARRFGVSPQNIMFMNGLTHTILLPGQRLRIPVGIVPL